MVLCSPGNACVVLRQCDGLADSVNLGDDISTEQAFCVRMPVGCASFCVYKRYMRSSPFERFSKRGRCCPATLRTRRLAYPDAIAVEDHQFVVRLHTQALNGVDVTCEPPALLEQDRTLPAL